MRLVSQRPDPISGKKSATGIMEVGEDDELRFIRQGGPEMFRIDLISVFEPLISKPSRLNGRSRSDKPGMPLRLKLTAPQLFNLAHSMYSIG